MTAQTQGPQHRKVLRRVNDEDLVLPVRNQLLEVAVLERSGPRWTARKGPRRTEEQVMGRTSRLCASDGRRISDSRQAAD